MNDSGKSVLWFLGCCLGLTEAALGAVAGLSDSINGAHIVILCTVSLFLVLAALVSMFFRNPQLLIAQSSDVVPLALLEKIQGWEDPRLVQMVLAQLISGVQGSAPVDTEEANVPVAEEKKEYEAKMKELLG